MRLSSGRLTTRPTSFDPVVELMISEDQCVFACGATVFTDHLKTVAAHNGAARDSGCERMFMNIIMKGTASPLRMRPSAPQSTSKLYHVIQSIHSCIHQ